MPFSFLPPPTPSLCQDVPDDTSSCSSSVSAQTQGSAVSMGSSASRSRTLPRPSSSRGMASSSGSGGVDEEDFEKAFLDAPTVNVSSFVCLCVCLRACLCVPCMLVCTCVCISCMYMCMCACLWCCCFTQTCRIAFCYR